MRRDLTRAGPSVYHSLLDVCVKSRAIAKRWIKFQNETLSALFLPVTAVQHVPLGATYSVGRRSAVLPRRRMTGPRGLRIFLTSALLSSENRLTRLKPKANGRFRNNTGRMTGWRSGSAVYRWCCAGLSEGTSSLPPVKRDTVHLWRQTSEQVNNSLIYNRRDERRWIFDLRRNIHGAEKWEKVKKKQREESAGCQQWNEPRTRCAERGLTGCLAPSVSATVARVWWICSQPVRGGYQESVACQSGGRTGGETRSSGRQRQCESLWSTVNWSLWGQGPWLRRMHHEAWGFFKNAPFFTDWKCVLQTAEIFLKRWFLFCFFFYSCGRFCVCLKKNTFFKRTKKKKLLFRMLC